MNYMARNYNRVSFNTFGTAVIGGYRAVIKAYYEIIKAASKMHGKVLNKRFVAEIEKNLEGVASISMSDRYNMGYKDMDIYLETRSININGYWEYYDNQIYCRNIHNVEKEFCDNDGRIAFTKVEIVCKGYIETCEKQIKEWKDAIDNFDKYENQLKMAVKQFGEAMKGINGFFIPTELRKYDWENN